MRPSKTRKRLSDEEIRKRRGQYYQRNKARIIAKSKKYFEDHKERILAGDKIKYQQERKKLGKTKPPGAIRYNPWTEPAHRQRMRDAHKGHTGYWTGKKFTKEMRQKLSVVHTERPTRYWLNKKCPHAAGENNPGYIDGRYPENRRQRNTMEYARWRQQVFERDAYTCRQCGIRGVRLHADHIKPFATHPRLRFELDNGRTLCVSCHRKTPTWGRRALAY